jgi:CHAT domain-containing protein
LYQGLLQYHEGRCIETLQLCAGTSTFLLSLWDVHDRNTAELMQKFYTNFIQTMNLARSLQSAVQELRAENPHPYFCAPFVLVGKVSET